MKNILALATLICLPIAAQEQLLSEIQPRTLPKIILRATSCNDIDFVQCLVDDDPEGTKLFFMNTNAELKNFGKKRCDDAYEQLIIDAKNNAPVGIIGFNENPYKTNTPSISYFIAKHHRQKGFGSAALGQFVNQAFVDYPHLISLNASVATTNKASSNLLTKNGFDLQAESVINGKSDLTYTLLNSYAPTWSIKIKRVAVKTRSLVDRYKYTVLWSLAINILMLMAAKLKDLKGRTP
jgi:RimJ/RimL family protein N-acetyltransferase